MSSLIDIASQIITIVKTAEAGLDVRYGLATSTGVITADKAAGVCVLSKRESPISLGANEQIIVYQVWAYAKTSPPSSPADSEKAVINLMDSIEDKLRASPTLNSYAMDSELSETNFNYEEIQPSIFAATAVLNLTVTRLIDP